MADKICVSGGFDPLHQGHLEMLREASAYGDLVVILNSDEWLLRKKGFVFLSWKTRAAIIGDLRYVTAVEPVNDHDDSVCEALHRIRPRFFANGGDRKPGNTPEVKTCKTHSIEMLWNSGGEKIDSSSDIARKSWVNRPWGGFVTLDEGKGYKVKKVKVEPGKAISLQYHSHRSEYWYMTGAGGMVELDGDVFAVAKGGPPVVVGQGVVHQLANIGQEPLVVIEVQSGEYLDEDDIIRVKESSL